jgi:hypothetical protein
MQQAHFRGENKMQHRCDSYSPSAAIRRRAVALAVASLLAAAGSAQAFEIDTGNDDLTMRWDNTFRYNVGWRVQSQNPVITGNVNADDGDRNFKSGSVVTNRLDILSEFDLVWQKKYGVRVSADAWGDAAYNHFDDTNTASANTLVNGLPVAGALSPYTKRYARGPSGEMLDWFTFGNFDIGDIPVSVKVGQHTVYWGESLFLVGLVHSIAYSQNSVDQWKGLANPGTEAKELFRPRGGVTVQAQPMSDLSIAGQWFYNWQAVRAPESGTYLSNLDPLNFGGDSTVLGPNPFAAVIPGAPTNLRLWNNNIVQPSRYSSSIGDFGVNARWSPEWLGGTLGLYYRNATDILPQLLATPGVATLPAATCTAIGGTALTPTTCLINNKATTVADLQKYGKAGTYQTAYGNNIHMYGLSLSKEFFGVSVGAEVSYRQNMPLVSDAVNVLPAPLAAITPGAIATTSVPSNGDTPGARGNTWHGLVNGLYTLPSTPLFDTANISVEFAGMHLDSVTQNPAVYKGRASYSAIDKPTTNFLGAAATFTPTWFQVFPGADITMPLTWTQGLSGTAATLFGGNKNTGNWSAGVGAIIYQKYLINLSYIGYFGNYSTAGGASCVQNCFAGTNAALSDRGWVSLTFKTTF